MTTPPTPAGWYPDPDGSGGQRYWDGSAWTEHRSPAGPPGAEVAGTEQPTVVVPTRSAPPEEHVGAHRAPDPEPEPEPTPPPAEPEHGPTAPVAQRMPPPPGPTFEPTFAPTFAQPAAPVDNRKLILWFSTACAALLAVLVLVIVYAAFIRDDTVEVASPTTSPSSTTEEAPTETETSAPGWGDPGPATETETQTGETVDGPLSFTVTGVETGTTVSSTETVAEKTAQGEYIVVRASVVNTSDAPVEWVGMFQKLHAGGTTYNVDDEATFYVGGNYLQIPPGGEVLVGLAYDVPPGTVAEAVELHVDPSTPGVLVPL